MLHTLNINIVLNKLLFLYWVGHEIIAILLIGGGSNTIIIYFPPFPPTLVIIIVPSTLIEYIISL